jgi:hypothetical protein
MKEKRKHKTQRGKIIKGEKNRTSVFEKISTKDRNSRN